MGSSFKTYYFYNTVLTRPTETTHQASVTLSDKTYSLETQTLCYFHYQSQIPFFYWIQNIFTNDGSRLQANTKYFNSWSPQYYQYNTHSNCTCAALSLPALRQSIAYLKIYLYQWYTSTSLFSNNVINTTQQECKRNSAITTWLKIHGPLSEWNDWHVIKSNSRDWCTQFWFRHPSNWRKFVIIRGSAFQNCGCK